MGGIAGWVVRTGALFVVARRKEIFVFTATASPLPGARSGWGYSRDARLVGPRRREALEHSERTRNAGIHGMEIVAGYRCDEHGPFAGSAGAVRRSSHRGIRVRLAAGVGEEMGTPEEIAGGVASGRHTPWYFREEKTGLRFSYGEVDARGFT